MWFLTSNATALSQLQTYFTPAASDINPNFPILWLLHLMKQTGPSCYAPLFHCYDYRKKKNTSKAAEGRFCWIDFLFSNHCVICKLCPGWKKPRGAMCKTSRAQSFIVRCKHRQPGMRAHDISNSVHWKSVTAVYTPEAPPALSGPVTKPFFC